LILKSIKDLFIDVLRVSLSKVRNEKVYFKNGDNGVLGDVNKKSKRKNEKPVVN